MKPIDLARKTNTPQPTMHRLVAGKSPNPHQDTLKPIANFFEITVEQLKGEEPLPSNIFPSESSKNFSIIEIPLLDWECLSEINQLDEDVEKIAAASDLSKKCFAIKMPDSSMEPQFPKGSVLIFDPDKTPADRGFILVKLAESQIHTFRQLLIDAEHQFLKPLNPDLNVFKMRLKTPEDVVLGTLVEARQTYAGM